MSLEVLYFVAVYLLRRFLYCDVCLAIYGRIRFFFFVSTGDVYIRMRRLIFAIFMYSIYVYKREGGISYANGVYVSTTLSDAEFHFTRAEKSVIRTNVGKNKSFFFSIRKSYNDLESSAR